MSPAWNALDAELDAWAAAGTTAEIWWRDDDAAAPSPALDRLLDLAARHGAPLALAAIPADAEAALAAALDRHAAETTVLQHGATHRNRAAAEAKKCELVDPADRPAGPAELAYGRALLARLFGARFHPVLVPPWNRIADALVGALPDLGYHGLSTYTPRKTARPVAGLCQVNCHVDVMQWRPEKRFLGSEAAVALLTGHLTAKRRGSVDAAEPTGLLTHHQVHDDDAWAFMDALLSRLSGHRAVRLLDAAAAFGLAQPVVAR